MEQVVIVGAVGPGGGKLSGARAKGGAPQQGAPGSGGEPASRSVPETTLSGW